MSEDHWRRACRGIKTGHRSQDQPENLFDEGRTFAGRYLDHLIDTNNRVVEIGSGNARIAMGLSDRQIEYLGVEPNRWCVDYWNEQFSGVPNFKFTHLDVRNRRYNPSGTISPRKARIPVADSWADVVLCVSLFTHLGTIKVAANYLREAYRILKPGGRFFSTWLTSPPFPVESTSPRMTVISREWIERALPRVGFEIVSVKDGTRPLKRDQWKIIAKANNGTGSPQ